MAVESIHDNIKSNEITAWKHSFYLRHSGDMTSPPQWSRCLHRGCTALQNLGTVVMTRHTLPPHTHSLQKVSNHYKEHPCKVSGGGLGGEVVQRNCWRTDRCKQVWTKEFHDGQWSITTAHLEDIVLRWAIKGLWATNIQTWANLYSPKSGGGIKSKDT